MAKSVELTIDPPQSGERPPLFADAAGTSFVNEAMILTFAYYDPSEVHMDRAHAAVFQQAAMPRSIFKEWLVGTVRMISELDDKKSFGWDDLRALIKEKGDG